MFLSAVPVNNWILENGEIGKKGKTAVAAEWCWNEKKLVLPLREGVVWVSKIAIVWNGNGKRNEGNDVASPRIAFPAGNFLGVLTVVAVPVSVATKRWGDARP